MSTYETEPHDEPTAPLTVGAEGDRCGDCGAPLAPDQRFCLECGHARAPARVELESLYAPAAPPPVPPRPPAPPSTPRGWFGITPNGLVAGMASTTCALIVGLVVGLVINRDKPEPVAQQPPVVNVAVPTPAPAVAVAPTITPEPLVPESTPDPDATPAPVEKDAEQLGKQELEEQQNADPETFQKESKKLDKAATEGAPPPVDDAKPGGDTGDDETQTFE